MSNRLVGGHIGCKGKTFHGIQSSFPMVVSYGQQYDVGEEPANFILALTATKVL